MNISREEARDALDVVQRANAGVERYRNYAHASPFLIVWGVVWAGANIVTDLRPDMSSTAWLAGIVAGTIATIFFSVRIALTEKRRGDQNVDARALRRRFIVLGITAWCYFPAMFVVLGPMSGRQQNAFISLFWAFTYMAAGAWLGMRLVIIGAVTAAGILFGFLFIDQHFSLWMATFGGGSLIAAGLWLRTL